ncbi:M56 family metallopeptidase [Plebeiibacterium sediminum]|uniref:M48 family metalloprotease n=1 Tax=Plebeiibacterium sediminum TaxID=2992112 RepID=A0AAE3SH00_9BACT|nr:M56 family metallopeptidase [Plebeiobacterium sediminum]MCW3788836.1 M48 family metalloprotease [Plebeiobacterium sediminum]
MKPIQSIFPPEITEALGWTIVHSLWQGTILLMILLILLSILRKYSSQVRYFISFTIIVIMLGWSISTFVNSYNYAKEKQNVKYELLQNPEYFKNLVNQSIDNTQAEQTQSFNIKLIKTRAWFQRNFPLFLSVWLIGIALFTVRLLGGLAYNRRLRGLQLLPFEEKWIEKMVEFSQELKINKIIKAFKSPHTNTPITLGFMKPIILFPVKAFTGLTEKEIEAIIAHELAHIVRNDYLFNIIQSIIEILFFFHPAVWTISKCIRDEREHSCDEIAIQLTGDKVTYAKALTNAQIFSSNEEALSMAFGKKQGNLLERIKRIQKNRSMKSHVTERIIASFIVISSIFLVSFSVGNQNMYQNLNEANSELSTNDSVKVIVVNKDINIPTKQERDSLIKVVEANIKVANENQSNIGKEVEQAIEIALSEKDRALSQEMFKEIHLALKEINLGDVMKQAQIEIKAAMDSINMDSINMEIKLSLQEAREEIAREMELHHLNSDSLGDCIEAQKLGLEAAKTGIEIAAEVLENLNIGDLVETSLKAAKIAVESANVEIEHLNIDSLINAELKNIDSELEKENLSKEREQLKKEMETLKQEMKQLKKELKEAEKQDNN